MVSSKPTISKIADFLNYLFTVKNLKPATIAGYRTAIADHLGHFGEEVSKSLDLNRLIASFYRDKPTANRGIPSWDLSLVLLALTKAPFEPLKDASLKILTFKTGISFWQKTGGGAFLDILLSQTQTSMEGGYYFSFSCVSSKKLVGFRWPRLTKTSGHSSFETFPELRFD